MLYNQEHTHILRVVYNFYQPIKLETFACGVQHSFWVDFLYPTPNSCVLV